MKTKRKNIIIIMCWLFTLGTVGIFVLTNLAAKQTIENTSELTATIEEIQINNTGENIYIEIFTDDYDAPLYISSNIGNRIDISSIKNLSKNETIIFRIENHTLEQLDEIGFINIVSLKTLDNEIFSLEDYNMFISKSSFPARVASGILAVSFLIISIYYTAKGYGCFVRKY